MVVGVLNPAFAFLPSAFQPIRQPQPLPPGAPMLASEAPLSGRLALSSLWQIEEPACDEATARQAASNLLALAPRLAWREPGKKGADGEVAEVRAGGPHSLSHADLK